MDQTLGHDQPNPRNDPRTDRMVEVLKAALVGALGEYKVASLELVKLKKRGDEDKYDDRMRQIPEHYHVHIRKKPKE